MFSGVDVPGHCHPHHHHQSLHSYHSLVEPPPDYDVGYNFVVSLQFKIKIFRIPLSLWQMNRQKRNPSGSDLSGGKVTREKTETFW